MAPALLTSEPETIRAGETVQWFRSFSSYPATTYTVKYYLRGPQNITLMAVAYNTTDHKIVVTAAISALWKGGNYIWESYAETGSGDTLERYFLESGTIQVILGLMASASHVKKTLDAIEALIEGRALSDVDSYSIQGRSISKMTPSEIIKWRSYYQQEYQKELDADRIAQGLGTSRKVGIRFRRL